MGRTLPLLALALLLAGCASVPFSTMWRFMNLSPEEVVTLDPAAVGIAVQLPDELALNENETTFDVEVFLGEGEAQRSMLKETSRLETVESGRRVLTPLPAAREGRHWHVLRLPEEARQSFREFQQRFDELLGQEEPKSVTFNVRPKFADAAAITGRKRITVMLRLFEDDSWFVLLKDAELDFEAMPPRNRETVAK